MIDEDVSHNIMQKTVDPHFFRIDNLVRTGLPPMPSSVMRISSLLSDLNVSQKRIADAISLDPVISSRVLSLANSPIYALRGSITRLTDAVNVVGSVNISNILLASGVSDAFGRRILDSPAGRKIWIHSLATGLAASEICHFARMRGADEAFSCGLLHDVGQLILLRADAPLYIDLIRNGEQTGDLSAIERDVFGFDHADLGAEAALKWSLPKPICHMIRHHHIPEHSSAGVALAHVIQTADEFVEGRVAYQDLDVFFENQDINKFGLNELDFDDIWENVTLRLSNMTNSV